MIIDELFEAPQQCPECGGISFSDLILAEKKDACYHKVKASAKVWPSAYASGRLVQCRKKGAANYGNKSEGVAEDWKGDLGVQGYAVGGPIGGLVGGAVGELTKEEQLNEFAPLLAAGARLVIAMAPKIAQVLKNTGKATAKAAAPVAKSGAEVAAKNAGQIGVGLGAYEIGSSVADIAKDITAKVGTALEEQTVMELAQVAFKFAIPAGIVLAILYGGKKVIDSLFSNSKTEQGVAEEYELAGVGVAYDLGRRAYRERKTIKDNPYSATREARKYDEWEKGLERGKHDANDAKFFRSSVREQGMAEGQLELNTPDPVVVVQDLKGKILDKINLSVAAQKYKLGQPQNIKTQLAHQNYTTIGNYVIVSPMSGQPQDATTQGVAETSLDEKSVSQAQFRTMAGAAHNPAFARKVGISQDVAQEFNQADKGSNYKKLPARATEGEQQKGADYRDPPKDKDPDQYGDDYQAMVARVKKLAGLGPMKTVYDPAKRVYRNVPTAVQPPKK
jgi:hypothetical protein